MSGNFRKQFPVNLFSNLIYFLINLIIGIWLPPYLIKNLGVAVYGLIPLAIAVNEYIGISTMAFNSAVARFLTIDLHKQDNEEANKTFNTAFWASLCIVILILPFILLVAYFSPRIFNIPVGEEAHSQAFFMSMVAVFCISAISSNFSVSSFALNRLDLRNTIRSSDVLVRALLIFLFFSFFSGRLQFVGTAYLSGSLVALACSFFVWKFLTPSLKITFKYFDKKKLGSLTHTSGWILVDQVGTVLFLSTELILVNKLCGSEAAGKYAVILPWVLLLRGTADMVCSTLSPMYFAYFAKGETENIKLLLKKSIKFLGLIIALPIGLICGFASALLSIWVGPSFAGLAPLIWILIGHMIFSGAIMPVFAIQVAFNKVRIPAIVTLFMGLSQIFLTIFFVRSLNLGIYGVAFSVAIVYLLRNIGFSALYVTRLLKVKFSTCIVSTIPGLVSMFIVFGIASILSQFLKPYSWLGLIFYCLILCVVYLYFTIRFILRSDDKKLFLSIMPTKVQKAFFAIGFNYDKS